MSIDKALFDFSEEVSRNKVNAGRMFVGMLRDPQALSLRMAINDSACDLIASEDAILSTLERDESTLTPINFEDFVWSLWTGQFDQRAAELLLRDNLLLSHASELIQATSQIAPDLKPLWSSVGRSLRGELEWWEERFKLWSRGLPDLACFLDGTDDFDWFTPTSIVCTRLSPSSTIAWKLDSTEVCEASAILPFDESSDRSRSAVQLSKKDNSFYVRVDADRLCGDWNCFCISDKFGSPVPSSFFALAIDNKHLPEVREKEPLRDAVALTKAGRFVEAWNSAAKSGTEGNALLQLQLHVMDIFFEMDSLVNQFADRVDQSLDSSGNLLYDFDFLALVDRRISKMKQALLGRIVPPRPGSI